MENKLPFIKCHGSGNDFVLIDAGLTHIKLDSETWPLSVRQLCDRSGIIGADGVLVVKPGNLPMEAEMRVFTPDGLETPMCINGIRCVGRYVLKRDALKTGVNISTRAGNIDVIAVESLASDVPAYRVSPVRPLLRNGIDELFGFRFSSIQVHTPHLIHVVDKINEPELFSLATRINAEKVRYPGGVNVTFVKVFDQESIYCRTYERGGIGLSLSCSSAMLASVYELCLRSVCSFGVSIKCYNKGGLVFCQCVHTDEEDVGSVIGNATFTYAGTVSPSPRGLGKVMQGEMYMEEIIAYGEFERKIKSAFREKDFLVSMN